MYAKSVDQISVAYDDDCDLRCEAVMHDGGVVISQLARVSEPPAVAAAVVCAVRVTAVIALGQSRSGADPGIFVELGSAGILSTVFNFLSARYTSIY